MMLMVMTIVAMASVTYLTRILGYLLMRRIQLSARAQSVMEAAPGCVLIALIAPRFVSERPADLLALVITVLAATRCSLLATVAIGVTAAGALRWLLG